MNNPSTPQIPESPPQAAPAQSQPGRDEAQVFVKKIQFAIDEAMIPASMVIGLLTMIQRDIMDQVIRMNTAASVPLVSAPISPLAMPGLPEALAAARAAAAGDQNGQN